MSLTIRQIAETLGLQIMGGSEVADATLITGVATLESAGAGDLAFVARPAYAERLASTGAGCVIVPPALADSAPVPALVCDQPHLAFARVATLLFPEPPAAGRRHPSAVVDGRADVSPDADVGAGAAVGPGSTVGPGVIIAPGAIVGANVSIGQHTRIGANVVIGDGTCIGARGRIQPGAIIGADGFGYSWNGSMWVRVPQLGRVLVGDDVEIGANTTIDRGALDDTVLGDGVVLDNLIQVAHNVRIGDHTAIAGCVGIAGSAVIGRRCMIGGGAGILGHIEIADDVQISAMSLVTNSIPEPGMYSSGTPLEAHADWRRNAARFRQLDVLARRVRVLEKREGGDKEKP